MYFTNGTATNEQDLVGQISTFLTGTCGWALKGTITDTGTDKDLVFFSRGSTPGKYCDLYIRWRGNADKIQVYAYTLWASAVVYNDQITDGTYTVCATGTSTIPYWLFGDPDGLWVMLKNGSSYYSAYGGYINTYYAAADDRWPIAIIGQSNPSTFFSGTRINAYSVISGTSAVYNSHDNNYTNLLAYGKSVRDGSNTAMPLPIYSPTTNKNEVRGELYGVLRFPGSGLAVESWYTVSGTNSKFFLHRLNDTHCYGYGPVPV